MPAGTLFITGDPDADRLLNTDPLALLLGMLLDQQVPMEWAFKGPATLKDRLGDLDANAIAAMDPEAVVTVFCDKPALHRFPASMARRAHELCVFLSEHYDGDAAALWKGATSGDELLRRLRELPGYGEEKAQIFLAILGKRFSIRPKGWEEAAGRFGDTTPRSVADIDSPESLAKVREFKKAMKAAKRDKQGRPDPAAAKQATAKATAPKMAAPAKKAATPNKAVAKKAAPAKKAATPKKAAATKKT